MILTNLSTLLRGLRIELRATGRTLFPPTWMEAGLFLFFFLLYAWIGYNILYHTKLIDVTNGLPGSYLGYDNLYHLDANGGTFDLLHPFFALFHLLKNLLIILFTTLLKEKTAGIVCLLLMNLSTTGGLVLLYRYLKQIVQVSTRRAFLLTILTGCFFTTVVLSFTTETYPISFFLLIFSLLMLSREYKLTGYIKGRTILFLSFLCGGVTSTNAIKPVMGGFLNRTPFLHMLRTGSKVILSFAACVAITAVLYTLICTFFSPETVSPIKTIQQLNQPLLPGDSFQKQVLVDFWGNTVMSTPLEEQPVGKEFVLRPTEYLHGWQNAVMVFLLALIASSVCLNITNKYVQLIVMYIGVDILIHFVLRYGMNEAVIFGGHWMFAIPLLLGWLYHRLPVRMYRILDWIVGAFLFLTIATNGMEFWRIYNTLL